MAKPSGGWFITAIVGLGFLLVASLPALLIVGGLQSRKIVEPVKGGVTTIGHVAYSTGQSELHGKVYDVTIIFTSRDGHVHLFDGPSATNKPKDGKPVKVSYDPANPDHAADLSAGSATWEVPFWIGVGLTPIEIGLLGWLLTRYLKGRRRSSPSPPA